MSAGTHAAILRLAAPLLVTNAIQALLNLTDTWFLGRLSTDAVAAMSAIYWIVSCVTMLVAGVALIVQSYVSQAVGARRLRAASAAAWCGVWASIATVPILLVVAAVGPLLLGSLGLDAIVTQRAVEFWQPRFAGLSLGLAAWALMGFFNGAGETRNTMVIALTTVLCNVPLNQWLIFDLGLGMAGAAWATNLAQLFGLLVGLAMFLGSEGRRRFHSHLTWRLRPSRAWRMFRTGLPVGFMYAADLIGVALMQIMVAQCGVPGAAATQVVMSLTALAYQPTLGIASAGSILVGQAIGARSLQQARQLGNRAIALCVGWMLCIALLLALGAPLLLPLFLDAATDAGSAALTIGLQIIWIAAAYQAFDGLYFGSGFALRAAGDTRVPALTALLLSWFLFVPLAHALVFDADGAWIPGLPQAGWGALGGWAALAVYAALLGSSMLIRWRLGHWQRLRLR